MSFVGHDKFLITKDPDFFSDIENFHCSPVQTGALPLQTAGGQGRPSVRVDTEVRVVMILMSKCSKVASKKSTVHFQPLQVLCGCKL